jgi:hypothetical protein
VVVVWVVTVPVVDSVVLDELDEEEDENRSKNNSILLRLGTGLYSPGRAKGNVFLFRLIIVTITTPFLLG